MILFCTYVNQLFMGRGPIILVILILLFHVLQTRDFQPGTILLSGGYLAKSGDFFFVFLGPHLQHMDSQARGRIRAVAAGLCQSQHFNLPSEARDRTCVLMDANQIHFCLAMPGIPGDIFDCRDCNLVWEMPGLPLYVPRWKGWPPEPRIIQPNVPIMPRLRSSAPHIFYLEREWDGLLARWPLKSSLLFKQRGIK